MLKKIVSLFFCFSAFALAAYATEVNQCENGERMPDYVEVVGCDAQPCPLKKGEDVVLYMNFTAYESIEQLEAKVRVKAIGINIDYPLPYPDACQELTNTHCPLEINEPAQYKLVMPIESWYPSIALKLTFYLVHNGQEDKRFVCFIVQAKVSN